MSEDFRNPILVALDVPTAEEAVQLAQQVAPHAGGFKVGLELLTGPGPGAVAVLSRMGKPLLVDAKLHDIPNTVRAAARGLGAAGARWVTAHAAGGRAMLEAAVEGLTEGAGARPAGVLAVTVLTSLDSSDLAETGTDSSPAALAACRARLSAGSGCEGVIASPRELSVIADAAPEMLKVTPGIRPASAASDDQVRTAAPSEALGWGADYLVIGRPITRASDPAAAAAAIVAGLAGGQPDREPPSPA